MAWRATQNLFIGVNPLLNSQLQQPTIGWTSFHFECINALKNQINAMLPDGYFAIAEQGLQISAEGAKRNRHPRPDVGVFKQGEARPVPTASSLQVTPVATLPLRETLALTDEDDSLIRLGVYALAENEAFPGKLITAIEVLSPANKPPSAHHPAYLAKRLRLLDSGINLVEIDLLHETRPILPIIPSYRDGDDNALPYNITVSVPHPSVHEGKFWHYGAAIDDALPTIALPLRLNESVALDMMQVYNTAYEGSPAFRLLVDYALEPVQIERYSATDQINIQGQLSQIHTTHFSTI